MDAKLLYLLLFWVGCMLTGCTSHEHSGNLPMLEMLPASQTGIQFNNQLREDGYLNIITYEYFYNGRGVGVGDINNDGLTDMFFTGNMVSNALYLNKGNFRFEDVTETANLATRGQWANGVAMVDINQDG